MGSYTVLDLFGKELETYFLTSDKEKELMTENSIGIRIANSAKKCPNCENYQKRKRKCWLKFIDGAGENMVCNFFKKQNGLTKS